MRVVEAGLFRSRSTGATLATDGRLRVISGATGGTTLTVFSIGFSTGSAGDAALIGFSTGSGGGVALTVFSIVLFRTGFGV